MTDNEVNGLCLQMWKDEQGCRITFSRPILNGSGVELSVDLSYEAMGQLITTLDNYISEQPNGAYGLHYFEVQDAEHQQ